MSDTAKAWIEERRAIHEAATDGPWHKTPNDRILSESVQWPEGDDYDVAGGFGRDGAVVEAIHDFDGNAIVDAHTNLPRALDALQAVLEEHKPIFYYEHEDSCMNTDEDHCAERHVEFDLGEYYCEDLPTGEEACDSCYDDEGERVAYPCATVQAIEGAIND